MHPPNCPKTLNLDVFNTSFNSFSICLYSKLLGRGHVICRLNLAGVHGLMEEVVVPALSSSSVFNSKQWQLQQHDLLLIQQRQQLEQLKKEQEELKSRLRRYGKVTNTQSAQQSTKYVPVTQPAPHQPVATLTKPVSSNPCTKSAKQKQNEVVDIINDENHKLADEVNIHKTEIIDASDNSSNNGNCDQPITFNVEDTSSVEAEGDAQGVTATFSQSTMPSSYDDERPIKPLPG